MIDEKINKTLSELESGLKNVESARKQVESTVNAYEGLKTTTAEYVTLLGNVTIKTKELVNAIGEDYVQKTKAFEKDREAIINASNAATEKLSNTTKEYKGVLYELKTKQKYCLIINVISLITLVAITVIAIYKIH